jgi:serine/threonine-protein kinase RsbT
MDSATGELYIRTESDIVVARRAVRNAATEIGFPSSEIARVVTAASELARNVFKYAGEGVMRWKPLARDSAIGIEVKFTDRGPGIVDIDRAMDEGYSTGGGLGMGLPGAKRLVDELEIQSAAGQGTTVTLKKWRRNPQGYS